MKLKINHLLHDNHGRLLLYKSYKPRTHSYGGFPRTNTETTKQRKGEEHFHLFNLYIRCNEK